MAVGGAGRTTGAAALLVALGIVLAAGALPALAGQTPLDRFSDSAADGVDDAGSAASNGGQPAAPGELDERVAAAAEDADMGGSARALAEMLSTLFGGTSGSAVEGAAGSASGEQQDGAKPSSTADSSGSTTPDGTGSTAAGDAQTDGPSSDSTTTDTSGNSGAGDGNTAGDGPTGSDAGDTADGGSANDGSSTGGTAGDATSADVTAADEPTSSGETATTSDETQTASDTGTAGESDASETSEVTDAGDNTASQAASQPDETAAGDDSPPEPEGLADQGRLGTAALVAAAVLLLLLAALAYRSDRNVIALVRSLPTLLANGVSRFVFGVASVIERAVAALRSVSTLRELRQLVRAAVSDTKRSVEQSVRSLLGRESATTTDSDTTASLSGDRERIRAAWRTVVDIAGVARYPTRTPGEIKQRAAATGLPEEPLSTLLGAFRAVEYGDREPGDRAAAATDAARQIETAATELAGEEADASDGDDMASDASDPEADS
jgi:hypothetical protein